MSRHGGNISALAASAGLKPEQILDFSASINPLGPPAWLRQVISSQVSNLVHYPQPHCDDLKWAVAKRYGVRAQEMSVGNGSTELLYLLPPLLSVSRAVVPVPSYVDYATAIGLAGLPLHQVVLSEASGFAMEKSPLQAELRAGDVVFVGRPNNPTGGVCDAAWLRELIRTQREITFIVDEAFGDLCCGFESVLRQGEAVPENVVVLISLTKAFAIPGLRLGVAIAGAKISEMLNRRLPPWSVNTFAQAVGLRAMEDGTYLEESRRYVAEQREILAGGLRELGFVVFAGKANYLLARGNADVRPMAEQLLRRHGIAIRVCNNFASLDARFFRVAVRTADENDRLLAALRDGENKGEPQKAQKAQEHSSAPFEPSVAESSATSAARSAFAYSIKNQKSKIENPQARTLMFQGCSSDAGKSVLTAAMCRILLQDGYRVAPFKAQNMSLNSFVTKDGGEMGRAQVTQAQACRLEPDVRMNPILLKPNSDTGSQVIVMGKPVGNMKVMEYIRYKPTAAKAARQAFDELRGQYDAVIIEGAGSPAEVNLKRHDIVNMGMARHAQSPVLLVGDIDRGGVYASFVGTMEVMEEWERQLIAGFVVNRFRGNADLLHDAHEYVLRHTGKPVLGVVRYLRDLGLPEEDSVAFKAGAFDNQGGSGAIDIAAIDLPHISNFTDLDALRIEPDVRVRIVRRGEELGHPDAVVIPGSKNVLGDLEFLRHTGLDQAIAKLAGSCQIIGICGGFQILGKSIEDPHAIESDRGAMQGLGLLPVVTVLEREKTLRRIAATHLPSGTALCGYEIHHGITSANGSAAMVRREDGEIIGSGSRDGQIWGTYLHGVFDSDAFRTWLLNGLRAKKGLPTQDRPGAIYDIDAAIDRLAGVVRGSLKMDEVYRVMGL